MMSNENHLDMKNDQGKYDNAKKYSNTHLYFAKTA